MPCETNFTSLFSLLCAFSILLLFLSDAKYRRSSCFHFLWNGIIAQASIFFFFRTELLFRQAFSSVSSTHCHRGPISQTQYNYPPQEITCCLTSERHLSQFQYALGFWFRIFRRLRHSCLYATHNPYSHNQFILSDPSLFRHLSNNDIGPPPLFSYVIVIVAYKDN